VYFIKWFFWALLTPLFPSGAGEIFFRFTLNVMILHMVMNEFVKFGGHVDI
jgi:hypothetical protein